MADMHCPADGHALRGGSYQGIRVDRCPACSGVWLDRARLEALEEIHEREYRGEPAAELDLGSQAYELARQKARGPRRCPGCGVEMEAREYARVSEVLIDVCPRCHGIWLDAGELEQLERFFERVRHEVSTPRNPLLAALRRLRRG